MKHKIAFLVLGMVALCGCVHQQTDKSDLRVSEADLNLCFPSRIILIDRDGLLYMPGSNTPFTGLAASGKGNGLVIQIRDGREVPWAIDGGIVHMRPAVQELSAEQIHRLNSDKPLIFTKNTDRSDNKNIE